MSKRKRNVDFMSVRKEKFDHIRSIFQSYISQVFDIGDKNDLNKIYEGFNKETFNHLGDILYKGYVASIKATNDAMNEAADYCNDKEIALPFPLVYKLQAFLEVMTMVEYMMAVDHRKLLGTDISLEDQCMIFEGTVEKGFDFLKNYEASNEYDSCLAGKFKNLEELFSSDTPAAEIAKEFAKDVSDIATPDLVYIINKMEGLLILSHSVPSKSEQLSRIESIVSSIVDISRKEIDRRRVSN